MFIDIADDHGSERLQCGTDGQCEQFVWKTAKKEWITEGNKPKALPKDDEKGLPFLKIDSRLDENKVFHMYASR